MRRVSLITITGMSLVCAVAAAAGGTHPETFVIPASRDGREATIKIPVGAVAMFSAANGEALVNYGHAGVEAMRLRGDVRINVIGKGQPIEIRAETIVLELTADESPGWTAWFRSSAARHSRSSEIIEDADDSQTLVGDVFFTVPTSFGAMQITADRVRHTLAGTAGSQPL